MQKVSAWVSDELAERVARAAEKDRRSISQWVALVLEERLDAAPTSARSRSKAAPASGCAHERTVKRTTGALGTRTFCEDCGALV